MSAIGITPWIGYQCGMCGRWFKSEDALREHVRPRGWRGRALYRLALGCYRAEHLARRLARMFERVSCRRAS